VTPARVVPGIAFVLFASAVFAAPPAGKLYKWVDEKGVVHYTQTIPADVNQKSNTVLDRRGRVVRKTDAALTQQQIQAIETDRVQAKLDAKKLEEQRRRDNALVNTYTTEAEIGEARDRAIAGAMQARQAIESRYKTALSRLDGTAKQIAAQRKTGKPLPEALAEDHAGHQREVDKIAADMRAKEGEIQRLRDKYEADTLRFRELTAGGKR